jgi:hypothetical protein
MSFSREIGREPPLIGRTHVLEREPSLPLDPDDMVHDAEALLVELEAAARAARPSTQPC